MMAYVIIPSILNAEDVCTKAMIVAAVDEAVSILEKEGKNGLHKVGEISIGDGVSLFVNDLNGYVLVHENQLLIGINLIGLEDDTGRRFYEDFIETTKSHQTTKEAITYYDGKGWVSYRWPKPGKKDFYQKITYVRGCLVDGANVYVGAGIYE